MNVEAWDADAVVPPATLPAGAEQFVYVPPGALTRGPEPGEVAILIEIDTYSG
jgi:hypothetical protein